ncbi:uncharacterized protein TRAVEDRAFT_17566 [Trametes versicolor FP-101664 SS1]|uniref:uncharacterized protein n=1 Tax=Trametes versicolor (strain FP-101664) TaxID=717944 RepID=UPI00046230D7|nr:uncharacterized protein TRAVEDRAFT_17566 [Trametes versicolor FP-101664 SS1]EIW63106.1 hypothetical protein TRAVEDRAFT_17566 [Trametes versicolor FP-101664 SS1]
MSQVDIRPLYPIPIQISLFENSSKTLDHNLDMSHHLEGHGEVFRPLTHDPANKRDQVTEGQDYPDNMRLPKAPQTPKESILALEQDVNSMRRLFDINDNICNVLGSIQRRPEIQNEVAPAPVIHRLPPEVLFIIFDTWREVALEFSSLWTDIVTGSSSALTFSRRANGLPLTVHTEIVGSRLSPVQNKALWRSKPRIRRLILRLQSRFEVKIFRSILAALAGTLESLVVMIGKSRAYRNRDRDFDPLFQGWTLFDGVIPTALKSLLIVSDQAIIPADSCPNLQTFTLKTSCWRAHSSTPTLLIHFLSHAPLLENLRLDIGCWFAQGRDIDPLPLPPPAPLYRLRNLSFRMSFPGVVWSDLVSPAPLSSPPLTPITSKLTDAVVDTVHLGGLSMLVSGMSRAAPHLHVSLVGFPGLGGMPGSGVLGFGLLPQWLTESTKTLRITLSQSGPNLRGTRSFLCIHAFRLLDTLIVRLAVGGYYLGQLGFWIACTNPSICPSPFLRVLVLSILNPGCTLDALHPLYKATTRRAEFGHPLKRLFVCSPAHTGPDYSIRDFHGVEWVSFSSTDVGAPCRDHVLRPTKTEEGRTEDLAGQLHAELPSSSPAYDTAWEACATEGLVETHARMRSWYKGSPLW